MTQNDIKKRSFPKYNNIPIHGTDDNLSTPTARKVLSDDDFTGFAIQMRGRRFIYIRGP